MEHEKLSAEKRGEALPEPQMKKTESGIEYKEYTFSNKEETHTARLFMSMSPARLVDEDETYEEYRMRRERIKYTIKEKKKGNTVWTPHPFGKATKGMVYNDKNREVMEAMKQKYEESLKEKEVIDAGE